MDTPNPRGIIDFNNDNVGQDMRSELGTEAVGNKSEAAGVLDGQDISHVINPGPADKPERNQDPKGRGV